MRKEEQDKIISNEGLRRENKSEDNSSAVLMKGATILTAALIVSKIFGAIFRIPLTNLIGAEGQSYYGVAYPVYQLFYAIATAGFPVAISRMVSERIAKKDYINAHKSYTLSLKISALIGLLSFLIMFLGASAIADLYKNPGAEASLKAVSLALLLAPIAASLRGYYQGRQDMKPTALTEIGEQMMRVAVGLSLAYAFYKTNLEKAAAGATFGASAGLAFALVLLGIIYVRESQVRRALIESSEVVDETNSQRVRQLFRYLIPITLGACIMPIMLNIDAAIIIRRLLATGWDSLSARKLYGLISGYCDPIIGLPSIFADAICISLMPAITTAFTLRKQDELDAHMKTGLKTMMIIAYPCAVGLIVLGKPILRMLFPAHIDEADMAVPTLQFLALSIITLSLMRIFQASLQGIGKMYIPMMNLVLGLFVKVFLTYVLVGIPALNVKGAAISSTAAYLVAGALNFRALKKHADIKVDTMDVFIKPLISALIMGISTIAVYKLVYMLLGSNLLGVAIAILSALLVYFVSIFKTRTISREEVEIIPKGDLIYRIAKKLKIAE